MSKNGLRMPQAVTSGNAARSINSLLGSVFAVSLLLAVPAEARITKLQITRTESPTFAGAAFGSAGQFEKIVGIAHGEVDPHDPLNAIIQDIALAPRNARGMVEYSTDFYLIKPIDMSKGNRMLFYNVGNRGNKGGLNTFNIGAQGGNEPTSAGDGFLQELGYTLIWSGWQPDILPGAGRTTMRVPIARNPDGSPITGLVRSEFSVAAPTNTQPLSAGRYTGASAPYPTANANNRTPFSDGFLPTLTVRDREPHPRIPIQNTQWAFGACPGGAVVTPSDTQICLLGAGFQPNKLYEVIYRAKDPIVMGLGYAGLRDLIAFFKHVPRDDFGTPNPLSVAGKRKGGEEIHGEWGRKGEDDDDDDDEEERATGQTKAVFSGSSQSGRNMRTFLHLGFNEDEDGRMVFEGAYPHIGGGRAQFNSRFSQAGRAWGHAHDHRYPAYEFPFAYQSTHDPLTGQTAGVLDRCLRTHTCPKIFHVATALEIWEGRQSLGLTDTLGKRDLSEPHFLRAYIMVSTQHGSAPFPPGFGECQQQLNPNPQVNTMRALWVAFTDWVKDGKEPPPSEFPRIRDNTLVHPSKVKFPSIPANNYGGVVRPATKFTGLANPLQVLDWGRSFNNRDESGIITIEPPLVGHRDYGVLVPQVDEDGNDLGGIRSTQLQAPTATYTGWNLGAAGTVQEDFLCTLSGSYIPFARTKAERQATGDPRRSLEERYKDHRGYVQAVQKATKKLVKDRFLLQRDADRLVSEAEASDILR